MVQITKSLSFMASAACFSTMLFMSSCSKDDAAMPSPEAIVTNDGSNLKTNLIGSGYGITPDGYLQPTDGPTCIGCKPSDWSFKIPSRDASSSLTAYAGNSLKKWVTPLNAPSTGSGSIITTVSDAVYAGEAFSTIKNLVKGKKYKFTYSVSTTSLNEAGISSPYAGEVWLSIQYTKPQDKIPTVITKKTSFANKKAQWITESIEFVAGDSEYHLVFSNMPTQGQTKLTYANIHVGPNAVKVVN